MADIGVLLLGLFLGGLLSFYFAKRQELYRLRLEAYKEYIEGIIARRRDTISIEEHFPEGSGGILRDEEIELQRKLLTIRVEEQKKEIEKKIDTSLKKIAVLGGRKTIKAIISSSKQEEGEILNPYRYLNIEEVINSMRGELSVEKIGKDDLKQYLEIGIT